jgi:hypothetical protein
VSTLTLTIGTDGGSVRVAVGVKKVVDVETTPAVGELCPLPCVRAIIAVTVA